MEGEVDARADMYMSCGRPGKVDYRMHCLLKSTVLSHVTSVLDCIYVMIYVGPDGSSADPGADPSETTSRTELVNSVPLAFLEIVKLGSV